MCSKKFWKIIGMVGISFFSALLGWAFNLKVSELGTWGFVSIIGLIGISVWLSLLD